MKSAFTLSEVAKIDRRAASDEERDCLPYVGLDDIEKEVGRFTRGFKRKPETMLATKFRFTPKHILYGKLRPYLNKVALPNFDGVCTTEILPILVNEKLVDRGYFHALLLAPEFVKWASANVSGANLPRLAPERLAQYRLALPPLNEQKRTAALLDKADRLRRTRRYVQEFSDGFLQSVFLEMFGDPMKNPMRWDVSLLEDLGTLDRGRSRHRPRNASQLLGGPYPLIQTGEVANSDGYIRTYKQTYSEMGLQQSKMWPKGTLCITIAANIAKTGILLFDACFPDSVVGFTANFKTNAEYVQQWFSFMQQHLERIAPESAQKNINLEILHGLQVPLPPLKLQKKFAEVVRRVERLRAQQREAARQAEHLFQTLLHRAFSDNAERILELQAPT